MRSNCLCLGRSRALSQARWSPVSGPDDAVALFRGEARQSMEQRIVHVLPEQHTAKK
jgi:hypothetical protein